MAYVNEGSCNFTCDLRVLSTSWMSHTCPLTVSHQRANVKGTTAFPSEVQW